MEILCLSEERASLNRNSRKNQKGSKVNSATVLPIAIGIWLTFLCIGKKVRELTKNKESIPCKKNKKIEPILPTSVQPPKQHTMLIKSLLAFGLLFSINTFAQQTRNIQQNILDEVMAERVVQQLGDYNLRGPVKSILQSTAEKNDTLEYLVFNQSGKSTFIKDREHQVRFTYQSDQLQSVQTIRFSYPNDTTVATYNAKGFLTEVISRYKRQYDKEVAQTTINYAIKENNGALEISTKYSYSFDENGWDVPKSDFYVARFNEDGTIKQITISNKHKEYTYGTTHSFRYDDQGRLAAVAYVSKDAGSNSAPDLRMVISYDDQLNTRTESLSDYTVRNSLWSFGYTKYEKFNENGDVIEYRFQHADDMYERKQIVLPSKGTNQVENLFTPEKYDYDYDAQGNWITKYSVQGDKRVPMITREIEYFESRQ